MNKSELIEAISDKLGGRAAASTAVEAIVEQVQRAVTAGEKVAITGFGVFEKADRAARTGRNPATGATVKIKKTSVPKFRPGAEFKAFVAGTKKMARPAKAAAKAPARATGRPASAATTAKAAPAAARRTGTAAKATKAAAAKATTRTPTKVSAAAKTLAKAPARSTKAAPAAKTTTRTPAKVSKAAKTLAKAPARAAKTPAKSPARKATRAR